jgi:hypothetical protein
VVAHTLFIKSLEFAASVSARWRTVVNFLVSQKQAGKNLKNDYEIGPYQIGKETGSRRAQGQE